MLIKLVLRRLPAENRARAACLDRAWRDAAACTAAPAAWEEADLRHLPYQGKLEQAMTLTHDDPESAGGLRPP